MGMLLMSQCLRHVCYTIYWQLWSGDVTGMTAVYVRALRENIINFNFLKEDIHACRKYGNTTQCLVSILMEPWLKS